MTRLERIKAAAKNADKEIAIKRAMLNKTGEGFDSMPSIYKPLDAANKADLPQDKEDVIFRSIIANTYLYMDSHEDVHLKNVFKKTIEETKTIYFLHDHEFKLAAQVGVIIKSYEKEVTWREVGLDIDGKTMALIHDVRIEKDKNASIFNMYKNGEITQHSVGMQYDKIKFAADDPEYKDSYALYTSILPLIGNKEKVQEQGYFYAVSEAKLRETSAVLMGSNDLTGVLDENKDETKEQELEKVLEKFDNIENIDKICNKYKDSLSNNEPSTDTQEEKKSSAYSMIK